MYPPDYNTGDDDMAPDDRGKVGMGEFADMAIDSIINGPYGMWSPSYNSRYNSSYSRPKKRISCNKCNSTMVYWEQLSSGRWCLYDSVTDKPHVCRKGDNKKDIIKHRQIYSCFNCIYINHKDKSCDEHNFITTYDSICNDYESSI
jgi:hypothetical protein